MMLRVFLLATLLVVAFADHHEEDDDHDGGFDHITDQYGCCSHEDRREIQYLWQSIWESSFTERKIMIAKAIFEELFERYPESRALFNRVHVEDMNSPEFRAHLLRITSGLDSIVSLLDDPSVLFKEVEHLADQHAAREGMKGIYITGILDAFDHVLPQIAPCFNLDAWHRCFTKITNMMAANLP